MLVAPVDTLTVSEVFALTRFGELTLSEGGLLVQPTELERPGPGAQAVAAENGRRKVLRRRLQREPQRDQPAVPEPDDTRAGR